MRQSGKFSARQNDARACEGDGVRMCACTMSASVLMMRESFQRMQATRRAAQGG